MATEIRRLLQENPLPPENPVVSASIVQVVQQTRAAHPRRNCGDYSVTLDMVIDPDSYRIPKLEKIAERVLGQEYSVLDPSDVLDPTFRTESALNLLFHAFLASDNTIWHFSSTINFPRNHGHSFQWSTY